MADKRGMTPTLCRRLPVLLLGALLAACGGGGDDPTAAEPAALSSPDPASTDPAPPADPDPVDPVDPADPAAPAALASCGLPDYQAQVLARVNALRAAGASCGGAGRFGPAGVLAWQGQLDQAAAGHAQDMAKQDYFSHTSLDGRTMSDRVDATGYVWRNLGENIAAGPRSVDAAIDGWRASDGHCANLMNPAFTEFALACVARDGTTYGRYWVMNLARPR